MVLTSVQTTANVFPASGQPGMLYDSGEFHDIIHKVALVDIPFGSFLVILANGVQLPGSSSDVLALGRGVAVQDPNKATTVGYKAGDVVACLQQGRIWVQAEGTEVLTAYKSPYVRYTANTSPTRPVGGYAGTSDSGKNVQPWGVRMFSTSTAGGMAVLELQAFYAASAGPT